MNFTFEQATKEQIRLRMALVGPTGSGKTYTALSLATSVGKNVAVIDTENNSASRYADEFEFQRLNLSHHAPDSYIGAIHAAEQAGFDFLIIDSLSHGWMGRDGALELVDKAAKRYKGNSFAAWRDVTPQHNALVDALIQCKCHLIVTMRAKTEWVVEKDSKGRSTPRKVGTSPIMRDGIEYEFDIVGDMDDQHHLVVSKTRCRVLDGEVIRKPGKELAESIASWLSDGIPTAEQTSVSSNNENSGATNSPTAEIDFYSETPETDHDGGRPQGLTTDEKHDDGLITSGQLKKLHVLGNMLYGDEWADKRPELVSYFTDGAELSSTQLTIEQAQELINGLEQQIEARQVQNTLSE
ncbi:MAG: ATP-binding protein [Chloroflexota bacterium]